MKLVLTHARTMQPGVTTGGPMPFVVGYTRVRPAGNCQVATSPGRLSRSFSWRDGDGTAATVADAPTNRGQQLRFGRQLTATPAPSR